MTNKVKLEVLKNTTRLNEIFQCLDIKFSFVSDKREGVFKQVSVPCKCRDFLGDILWSRALKQPVSIYGMSYDYSKAPYDEDRLKLSLKFPSEETKETFLRKFSKFLGEKERLAGIKEYTQVIETEESDTIIVIASSHWQQSVWKLSLYTYYLKLCSYDNPKCLPPNAVELEYSEVLTRKLEKTLLSHITDESVEFSPILLYNHNYGGFVSSIKRRMPLSTYNHIFGESAHEM